MDGFMDTYHTYTSRGVVNEMVVATKVFQDEKPLPRPFSPVCAFLLGSAGLFQDYSLSRRFSRSILFFPLCEADESLLFFLHNVVGTDSTIIQSSWLVVGVGVRVVRKKKKEKYGKLCRHQLISQIFCFVQQD